MDKKLNAVMHTLTPWKQAKDKSWSLKDSLGNHFLSLSTPCERIPEFESNVAFIVKAVNAHKELLEALKALVADTDCYCQSDKEVGLTGTCALHAAEEAIRRAEGIL